MRPESGRRGLSPPVGLGRLLLSDPASGNCLPRPGPPLLSLQFTPSPSPVACTLAACVWHSVGRCCCCCTLPEDGKTQIWAGEEERAGISLH